MSETLATVAVDGQGGLPGPVLKGLESRKLKDLFFEATATPLRTGALAPDLAEHLSAYLQSVWGQPHYGVSAPAKGAYPAVAFAGIAWWANPSNRDYAREYLRERKTGQYTWPRTQNAYVPYLATEKEAFAKLATITTLTDSEIDRYNKLLAAAYPQGAGDSGLIGSRC